MQYGSPMLPATPGDLHDRDDTRCVRRCALVAVLVGSLLSACSSDAGEVSVNSSRTTPSDIRPSSSEAAPGSAADTSPETEPTPTTVVTDVTGTPYAQELANVDDNGDRSLDSILKIFSLAVAPLPGVEVPESSYQPRSATIALSDVEAHYGELTSAQQKVVDAVISPDGDQIIVPASFRRPALDQFADQVSGGIRAARETIATKLGKIDGDISYILVQAKFAGLARPLWSDSETYLGCAIQIDTVQNADDATLLSTITHEVFHCYEAALGKTRANWQNKGRWLTEGGAEWAALVLVGGDPSDDYWWRAWLTTTDEPLFAYSYSAMGFFFHLDESGIDPWEVFPAMMQASGNAAAFSASGADAEAFMATWASGFFREPDRGDAWDLTGVRISNDKGPWVPLSVDDGQTVAFVAGAYKHSGYRLAVNAEVVTFSTTGYVRLHDGATDIARLSASTFCAKQGGCGKCPDGTPLRNDPQPLGTTVLLGVSSGALSSSGTVTGQSIADYCKDQTAVWVRFERPGSPGVLPGNVVEIYGCQGPFGGWQGVLRSGGLDAGDGFVVPFAEIPLTFAFSGEGAQTTHTATNGNVPTPIGNITVAFELDIAIDADATTMSITGTGTAATDIISVSDFIGDGGSALPIEPAPPGSCA